MILAIFLVVFDGFFNCSARPAKLFIDFAYKEFSYVQSVYSGTLMLGQVGLLAHFGV